MGDPLPTSDVPTPPTEDHVPTKAKGVREISPAMGVGHKTLLPVI
jgi:hypothetical protein